MKNIIFVRHGETEHNNVRVFQSDDVPLNEAGVRQAEELANKLKSKDADIILHSPLRRATQTATIIASWKNTPLTKSDTLVEFRTPLFIRGKSYDDPEADRIYREWTDKLLLEHSLGDDEAENYYDLYRRSSAILEGLGSRSESSIIAVSHSEIIRATIAYVLLGDSANVMQINSVMKSIKLGNARTVTIRYDESKGKWRLVL